VKEAQTVGRIDLVKPKGDLMFFKHFLEHRGYEVKTFDVTEPYLPDANDLPDCIIVSWGPYSRFAFDIDEQLRACGLRIPLVVASTHPPDSADEPLPELLRAILRSEDLPHDGFYSVIDEVIRRPQAEGAAPRLLTWSSLDDT
jgi:hypothetical protein